MTDRLITERYRVVLPAVCWNRRRADFYAVTEGLLPDGIRFRSALVPAMGEELTCSIRHIGTVEGTVVRVGAQKFIVKVRAQPQTAVRIAQDMVELARQQAPPVTAVRAAPRVIPVQKDVTVHLPCGRAVAGVLLNVSASGAALSIPEAVEVGAPLRIGRTPARMVRQFETGIGVAFVTPLDPRTVDETIIL